MSEFWFYFNLGLKHVLDINAYDHVLFMIALVVPFTFKNWKDVLLLVTLFTIGHTMALILSVYNVVSVKASLVEFLIPVTILLTAIYNLAGAGKPAGKNITVSAVVTLFFGLIHGLGFANYFKMIINGNAEGKLLPLLEFALGIEASHIIVVTAVLLLALLVQHLLKFSRRDWMLVASAFVIGVALPMVIESEIWQ